MLRFMSPSRLFGAVVLVLVVVVGVSAQGKPPEKMPPTNLTTTGFRPLYVPVPATVSYTACNSSTVPFSTIYRPQTNDSVYRFGFDASGGGVVYAIVGPCGGSVSVPVDNLSRPYVIEVPCANQSASVPISMTAAALSCAVTQNALVVSNVNVHVGP